MMNTSKPKLSSKNNRNYRHLGINLQTELHALMSRWFYFYCFNNRNIVNANSENTQITKLILKLTNPSNNSSISIEEIDSVPLVSNTG